MLGLTRPVWAVQVTLNHRAEDRVRAIWAALDAGGVESLGSVPGTEHRPHVTLAVFDDADEEVVAPALAPVVGHCLGMPLTLAALGLSLSPGSMAAYLGVTPTARLLELHRGVHVALEGLVDGSSPLYQPGTLVPHCTLAVGFTDAAAVIEAIGTDQIPVHAAAHEVHLVEVSSGRSRVRLA